MADNGGFDNLQAMVEVLWKRRMAELVDDKAGLSLDSCSIQGHQKRFTAKRDSGFWNQIEERRGLVVVLLGLRGRLGQNLGQLPMAGDSDKALAYLHGRSGGQWR